MQTKLNIGFVLHGEFLPAWYAETIALLRKENHRLFFLCLPVQEKRAPALPLMYRLFSKFEEGWFQPERDARHPVSINEVIKDDKQITCNADSDQLDERCLEEVKGLALDLVYTINFNSSSAENISSTARFGLWYIHFGFGAYRNSQPPAFWEVMDHSPVIGSYLLMRKGDIDSILYEGTTTAVPFSVKNTFNSIAWKSASYLLHRARTLVALHDSFSNVYNKQLIGDVAEKKFPGNTSMLFLFGRNLFRYVVYKRKLKQKEDRFTLLYASGVLQPEALATTAFNTVELPDGHFYADPFVIEKEDKQYVFFEEFSDAKQKAHISLIEINQSGRLSPVGMVLEKNYHLSYPFVFDVKGSFYMIPETSANGTVELYQAASFPHQWEFVMNLMEGEALIDCTVFFNDGKWWLFANGSNHPSVSTNDQLFLYYNDDLFSTDWTPHPMNPIATHAANCRPAGKIFKMDGKIYRPAQNNASQQYGFGLNINEVETLTIDDYSERMVHCIHPEQLGLKAIHHLDFSTTLTIIDGIVKE